MGANNQFLTESHPADISPMQLLSNYYSLIGGKRIVESQVSDAINGSIEVASFSLEPVVNLAAKPPTTNFWLGTGVYFISSIILPLLDIQDVGNVGP